LHFGRSDASLAACHRGPSAVGKGPGASFCCTQYCSRVNYCVQTTILISNHCFTTAEALAKNESSNPRNVAATAACLPE